MSPAEKNKTTVRLVFFGAAGVGKTALIRRFLHDNFELKHKRTVEELHSIEHDLDGTKMRIEIMDTSGSYSFPAMRQLCIRQSDAFALVYSINDPESFEEVHRLREEILEQKGSKLVPITVVGNKADLGNQRRVPAKESMNIVELDWSASFVEASAKSGLNVAGVFEELLRQVNFPSSLSAALQVRRGNGPKDGTLMRKKPLINKADSCTVS